MTLSITHTTPADGTFSTTGAAAWNATHSLGGVADISQGGTNATTAAGARTALGLGTIATQDANAVAVTGGTINGTTVGATTAAAGSFTTLNSSGNTRLGGLSGNQSLQVNNVSGGVNYATIVSGTAGGSPVYYAQGSDPNINLAFGTKGTGQYFFNTGGGLQLAIGNAASAVNYFQLNGSATGGSANMSAQGSDANVGLGYFTKNNGFHFFYAAGVAQAAIAPTASAVNYLNLTGAATGAAPTISAQGSDANIGLVLNGKGTGVVALGGSTVANSGLVVLPTASSVNYLQIGSGAAGFSPSIAAVGADNPISINITTKGSAGNTTFYSQNFAYVAFAIKSAGSAVNYLQTISAVTTGAPELSAQGSDANINLKLTPKGTGTVQFGTYTAGIVAQAGYITITDAGGTSRRLLVG